MSVATDHTGPWTLADVLALPEDRTTRYELLGESQRLLCCADEDPAPIAARRR